MSESTSGFSSCGRDHFAMLGERVRLQLRERIVAARVGGRLEANASRFTGAFVSPERLDDAAAHRGVGSVTDELAMVRGQLATMSRTIELRCAGSREVGVRLPMDRIRAAFSLSAQAVELLTLAVAAHHLEEVRRSVALLQDDFTRQIPDGSLAASLLTESEEERLQVLDELRLDAPLLRHRLLVPELPADYDRISPLRMTLLVARRVVEYLLDDTGVDPALEGVAQLLHAPRRPRDATESLVLSESVAERVREVVDEVLARYNTSPVPAPLLRIRGPVGSGRHTVAANIASMMRRGALGVDVGRMRSGDPAVAIRNVCREARLLDAILVVDGLDEADDGLLAVLAHIAPNEEVPWVLCLGPETRSFEVADRPHLGLELGLPDFDTRCEIWRRTTARHGAKLSPHEVEQMASRYRVTGGVIAEVVAEVVAAGDTRQQELDTSVLDAAVGRRSSHRLGDLADSLTPGGDWSQLIAPPSVREALELMVSQYKLGDRVFSEWGFEQVLSRRGLTALFHGPPGTGKTLSARILARVLDLEVYRVDVSRIVSKYIGETEKNLATIFDEASSGQAILLFDEADSLFGARTAVRSSSDRHANLETNYLLQRIESFEGIVVLTTNLDSSIDEAFARRLNFRVYFPPPDEEDRAKLWKILIPSRAIGDCSIDYEALAKRFEMSGGHIANSALKAAFMAAGEGGNVSMAHLLEAAGAEYRSMGKLVRDPDADKKGRR